MDDLVYYYTEEHKKHFSSGHPERPERVEIIRKALDHSGLWKKYPKIKPLDVFQEVISAIHSEIYVNELKSHCQISKSFDTDTYTTPDSWQLSLNTAGGAAAVALSVWQREAQRGFALSRPPGHHATHNKAMGFCLINNIAIAAEYLLQTQKAEKIAIIDIDVHHGNGTQDIFYSRQDVLYISIHQYPLYPMTGTIDEIGIGDGKGYNLNLPFPPFSGDKARIAAFDQIILPMLDRYLPNMVLVSFGFDAHWRDPLSQQLASAENYGLSIRKLSKWADQHCQGRIALFLEGGYDLLAARATSLAVTHALLGLPWRDSLVPSPQAETDDWRSIISQAKKIWDL